MCKPMDENVIREKIKKAIKMLFSNDVWLLEHDVSEQSITHKLAEYMQPLFPDYNVDCEYNGDVTRNGNRKHIEVLKSVLRKKGFLGENEVYEAASEFVDRAVRPDIIVHRRGTNDYNLCIIEVKKTTNRALQGYDQIKLKAYTSDKYGNNLKYQIGLFIEFAAGTKKMHGKILYFKGGKKADSESV